VAGSWGPVELVVAAAIAPLLESVGSNLRTTRRSSGLALNFRDVSERKALEEQLRSSRSTIR
jgi:hypothetical protein